jgi:hypothetical protein
MGYELELDHAALGEEVRHVADGESGLVGDGLQEIFRSEVLGGFDEEDGAACFVGRMTDSANVEGTAVDGLVGDGSLHPGGE